MNRIKIILVLLIILLIFGCIAPEKKSAKTYVYEYDDKVTVVDDFGFNVTVKKYPKRIVSLAPSNTEILFALGLGDRVVGVTDYCNYPPEVIKKRERGEIQSIGGYTTVDVEKVIALNPDLVIASYGNGIQVVNAIKKFGIPVICLNPRNLEDIMRDIYIIGKVCNAEENATKLIEFMKNKINNIKNKIKNIKTRPRVIHIIWNDPIWVSGNNTFIDEIIELAGGENAIKYEGWVVISLEDLLRLNPDIIIVSSGTGMSKGRNILYEWVIKIRDLKAVKNNRVYVIDVDIISRPSYRLVYALEQLARFIHPEVFEREKVYSSPVLDTSRYHSHNTAFGLCAYTSKDCFKSSSRCS